MGQACLELLLPLILGEAGRQAVHRWGNAGLGTVTAAVVRCNHGVASA
jgi:hypothetical protein